MGMYIMHICDEVGQTEAYGIWDKPNHLRSLQHKNVNDVESWQTFQRKCGFLFRIFAMKSGSTSTSLHEKSQIL